MVSPQHWGKGLARAATAMVVQHLDTELGCRNVLACIEQTNTRSVALVQALGFERASPALDAHHGLSPTEVLYVLSRGAKG
jgi:RimJ/RimL family protein N-acetyltransferase